MHVKRAAAMRSSRHVGPEPRLTARGATPLTAAARIQKLRHSRCIYHATVSSTSKRAFPFSFTFYVSLVVHSSPLFATVCPFVSERLGDTCWERLHLIQLFYFITTPIRSLVSTTKQIVSKRRASPSSDSKSLAAQFSLTECAPWTVT